MEQLGESLKIISLDTIPSTNDYLKDYLKKGEQSLPILVNAREQTAGRGRDQRSWISLKDKGIYFSMAILLHDNKNLAYLPLLTGLSVIEGLERTAKVPFNLKWPNDIMVAEKKIAGILIENMISENSAICIVGVGVNINYQKSDFPPTFQHQATSLKIETGKMFTLEIIKQNLVQIFFQRWQKLQQLGGTRIVSDAASRSQYWQGKVITFHMGKQTVRGIFLGINQDGSILLQEADGTRKSYFSGEILY